MKVKEESEKAEMKLNIQKTRIMASSPITSWQREGETVKALTDFIFLAAKSLLKRKLQSSGLLMWRTHSLEKTVMLGKIEGGRRRGWERMRWVDGIMDPMDMSLSKFWETLEDRGAWHAAVHGDTNSRTQLIDWTTATSQNSLFWRKKSKEVRTEKQVSIKHP